MPRQFNGGNGGLLAREAQWKQSQRSSAHDTSWMLQLQTVKFQQQCFLTELFSMPKDIWQCLETLPVSQVTGRRTSMASRDKGIYTMVHSICQRKFPQQSSICLFLLENPAFEENIVENLSCSMLTVLTCNTKTMMHFNKIKQINANDVDFTWEQWKVYHAQSIWKSYF